MIEFQPGFEILRYEVIPSRRKGANQLILQRYYKPSYFF